MDLKTQERISKLMSEQADKLGKALEALRRIRDLPKDIPVQEAKVRASTALKEIANYGKNPKDL